MLAKQISRDKEIFCTSETPLPEVFHKMSALGCRCMPVLESSAHPIIIGTITEHDICHKIISGGLNPQRSSAARFLNGEFTTVSGDATIEECAELLRLSATERLFVVDENRTFLGILTEADLNPPKPRVSLETVITDLSVPASAPRQVPLSH